MNKSSREIKDRIRDSSRFIIDYLVFDLNKEVRIIHSVCSCSVYIYFDNKKIKISDHDYHKEQRDYFIDVKAYLTPMNVFRHFVLNCINQ